MMSEEKKKSFTMETFNFKNRPIGDEETCNKWWKNIENGLYDLFNYNAAGVNFEQCYRDAYNLVLHKRGEKLYSGVVRTLTAHLEGISTALEAEPAGVTFLEKLNRKWTAYKHGLSMTQDVLMYMDKTFVASTNKTPVHELGLNLWRETVIFSGDCLTRIVNTLLEQIQRERKGEVINKELIKNSVQMLIDLGDSVYQQNFETQFLQVSADFYRVKSQELIECCNWREYLKKVEESLSEEKERVANYLNAKTKAKITNVVQQEMVANHKLRLVNSESLISLLLGDKYEDLERMYTTFSRVGDGVDTIRDVMTSHIREVCEQLATDSERVKNDCSEEFAQRLKEQRQKYDMIVSLAFKNDQTFVDALTPLFEFYERRLAN